MKLCLAEFNQEQARARLTRRKLWRRLLPERVELVHFPYYCFVLEVEDRAGRRQIQAAADGIFGTLVLMDNQKLRWSESEFQPEFAFRLSQADAIAKVKEDYGWILYRARLRRYPCRLLKVDNNENFYYPYWVGYFRIRGKWEFDLLDAITGLVLGGPLRTAFIHALCAWAEGQMPPGEIEERK